MRDTSAMVARDSATTQPRIAFAGDRDVAVGVLRFLRGEGVEPLVLLLPEDSSHGDELLALCPWLAPERVLRGGSFAEPEGVRLLASLALDWILCVHFPLIVPGPVLSLPREGALNLHPGFLPWGRGWHTPSWALLEGSPAGATLHFMDEGLDTGDIVAQERLEVSPGDTAHSLYRRLKRLELELFRRTWPALAAGSYDRRPQEGSGSSHRRSELLEDRVQRIDLAESTTAGELLRRLRALTTDRWEEACWYEAGGRRYPVRTEITPEPEERPPEPEEGRAPLPRRRGR